MSEQELPVQIAQVDGVHVYDVDLGKAHQGKVFEKFTTQTPSTNHQYLSRK
jgi:hypothetical protein